MVSGASDLNPIPILFQSYLVISLTKELQLLRLFVHKHSVQMSSLNTPDFKSHSTSKQHELFEPMAPKEIQT